MPAENDENAPTEILRTVPRRSKSYERKHLTPGEVERITDAARARGRHGARDALAIRLCARHGFRVSELCALRWDQIDFDTCQMHVARLKNGIPSTHPLNGPEMRALRQQQRLVSGPYVFMNERGARMTPAGFARMFDRAARSINFSLKVHPHMLRHACGYNYANQGKTTRAIQIWMGHRNIGMTTIYTELASDHFKDW